MAFGTAIILFVFRNFYLLMLGPLLAPPPLRSGLGVVEYHVLGKRRLCRDEFSTLQLRTRKQKKSSMIKISEKKRSIQPPGWSEELVGKGEALTNFSVPLLGSMGRSHGGGHEYDTFSTASATRR